MRTSSLALVRCFGSVRGTSKGGGVGAVISLLLIRGFDLLEPGIAPGGAAARSPGSTLSSVPGRKRPPHCGQTTRLLGGSVAGILIFFLQSGQVTVRVDMRPRLLGADGQLAAPDLLSDQNAPFPGQ